MDILWLDDPACHDRAVAGGKAANLSRLAAGYPVPPGFCLTMAAFERAVASGLILDETALAPGGLPPALYEALAAAYTQLAHRCGQAAPNVAVRSSAVDEDGTLASFAGQHATYLNVAGVDAVAAAVVRCWASLASEQTRAYRRQHGLALEPARLAVLVQQLVAADVAAVVFSANPVTGSRDEVVINASWGLGESIVGGTVTPDTYVVRKADLAVVARHVAEKRRMTVAIPGGTREVDVPRVLSSRATLDDEQAAGMARLVVALEARMGWPVDVECAYQAGHLYLLQCRPITTLG